MNLRAKTLVVLGLTLFSLMLILAWSSRSLLVLLMGSLALLSFSSLALLEKAVLSRLSRLDAELEAIALKGEPSDKVSIEGTDEISHLASSINTMLSALEKSQADTKEHENHLSTIFASLQVGMVIIDAESHRILEANPTAAEMCGSVREDMLGKSCHRFICPAEEGKCPVDCGQFVESSERSLLRTDGEVLPIMKTVVPIMRKERKLYLETFVDLSENKKTEARLNYLAYHDPLTGLPNRLLFYDRLEQALARARRHKEPLAIMLLDLDRFQEINDTLGHETGDRLLKMTAKQLLKGVRESDTIAHLSGDEFFFILPDADAAGAERTASRLLKGFQIPFSIDSHELYVTPSIGISIYPYDGETPEILVKNADLAMYRAKAQGKNQYQFFTPDMGKAVFQRRTIENHLRKAIEREEFRVHYQPQVNIESGRIVGMEALVRWQHPEQGMIPPLNFIPVAEETGLILPISDWVLRTACTQNKAWQAMGLPPVRVAINLAARQFQQQNLLENIFKVLDELNLPPQWLELEITESTAMQNLDVTIEILNQLSERGVRIAIDDFGTGYSSLSYLKKFPINALKIDRSFIKDVTLDPDSAAIVTAIIAMAKNLKVKVIAEGVETSEQLEFLRKYGCDEIQGYLFSRPVPPEDFVELLRG